MTQESDRKIAFFDIDKTMYQGFLVFPLVEAQARDGLLDMPEYSKVIEAQKAFDEEKLTYGEMVQEVLRHYALGLAGKQEVDASEHTYSYMSGEGNKFYPYVDEVMSLMRESHDIYLVTAEPQFIAESVSKRYSANGCVSTIFKTDNGVFTGDIDKVFSSSHHKVEAISHLLAEHNPTDSFAFGDSEGDIGMLEAVEYPVCVDPSKGLLEIAKKRDWFVAKSPEEITPYVEMKLAR